MKKTIISGVNIDINNNSKKFPIKFNKIKGNTKQETTEGYQLLDMLDEVPYAEGSGLTTFIDSEGYLNIKGTTTRAWDYNVSNAIEFKANTKYNFAIDIIEPSNTQGITFYFSFSGNNGKSISLSNIYKTATKNVVENQSLQLKFSMAPSRILDTKIKVMVNTGETFKKWEPYTGGQASPNPDYPQEVECVKGNVEVKQTGKNLFDKSKAVLNHELNGTNGEIMNSQNHYFVTNYILIKPNTNYIFSGKGDGVSNCFYDKNKQFIQTIRGQGTAQSGGFITTPNNPNIKYLRINTGENYIDTLQIEEGTQPTEYEPYKETIYPIKLGNIELNGNTELIDKPYKENGKWYFDIKWIKYEYNGNEAWEYGTGDFSVPRQLVKTRTRNCLSNYFRKRISENIEYNMVYVGGLYVNFRTDKFKSVAEWKQWLQKIKNEGNPLYIIAEREKPEKTEITDPVLINQLNSMNNSKVNSEVVHISNNSNAELEVEYVSIEDSKEGIIKPTWVKENGNEIFPVTHNRAILGGLSYKAYNINDSIYVNDWNNVIDNGYYYDNNGYNRPPIGINSYTNNLLIKVTKIKDNTVIQEIISDNNELFDSIDKDKVGIIKDKYSRIGVELNDSVVWGNWHVNNNESLTSRTYTELNGSTSTVRKITISGINDLNQLKDKVIFIKSLNIGSSSSTTLQINNLVSKQIRLNVGVNNSLISGWVKPNQIYSISYDGEFFNLLSNGDKPGNYLPLSGGELVTNQYNGLTIKRKDGNGSSILFKNSTGNLGKIGFSAEGSLIITGKTGIDGDANLLYVGADGSIGCKGNSIYSTKSTATLGTSSNKWNEAYINTVHGNSDTTTKLKTPVKINGVDFDGSQNITITAESVSNEGHIIINESGQAMNKRSKLKFTNSTVSDDPGNDTTIISPKGISGNYLPLSGGTLTGSLIINQSSGNRSLSTKGELNVSTVAGNAKLFLNNKEVLQGSDNWLRINSTKAFSSGVYFGGSIIRADNQIQIEQDGTYFLAQNNLVRTNGEFKTMKGVVNYKDKAVVQYNDAEECIEFVFN